MVGKIQNSEKEIYAGVRANTLTNELLAVKVKEHESLISEFKNKESEFKVLAKKRDIEIVGEIKKRIAQALIQFAKQNGYTMVLDSSQSNAIIEEEPVDVTKEFIKFYNDSFEKEKPQ